MRRWLALLVACLLQPLAALAGSGLVTSGEHPGFTRIVIQFYGPINWQLGRTLDGYALRLQHERPDYQLNKAFNLIGKNRLAAIWADAKTGDLHFGIACQCYAMPFEFRSGIVVVDLHDGTPPKDSSFEVPLDISAPIPDLLARHDSAKSDSGASQNIPAIYDWTSLSLQHLRSITSAPMDAAMAALQADDLTTDSGLEALRLSLMDEMSRGASAGIVDMARPMKTPATGSPGAGLSVQIHFGDTPNLIIRQKWQGNAPMSAAGGQCIADAQLDLMAWGSDRPAAEQFGPAREGLTGEFDKPDADAVTRAARFLLFLGFGAEASGLSRSFPDNLPDKVIWGSLAAIMDDVPDPKSAFTGMADCDTAAALWATLADLAARPTSDIGKAAVLHNFSALPAHLRRLVGPRLVARFLAAGDIVVATALQDAILRAPGDPGPEIVLMQAEMDRAIGQPRKAEAQLQPLANSAGPGSGDALVALVEQRAALGQSVSFPQVQTLEALLRERKGSAEEPRYQRALILGEAASGDIERAFTESAKSPDVRPALWQILAISGPDSALLNVATLPAQSPPPPEAREAASVIAERMLDLGLADQALAWLNLDDKAPVPLHARIELARGNPQTALQLLQTDVSPPSLAIRAEALRALHDQKSAAEIFEKLGKTDQQWTAITQTQAWDVVAKGGPEPWKAVASVISLPAESETNGTASPMIVPDGQGPLARNTALVQDSATTRDAIAKLLNLVKTPIPPTQ